MKQILAITLLAFGLNAYGQDKLEVTLDQALEMALESNQTLKNADLDIQQSKQQVKEILSTGLPQINGNVGFTHNVEIPTSVIPSFDVPGEFMQVQFGIPFSMQAMVGMNQLIVDGTFFLGVKAASEFVKISELMASKSRLDVKEGVTKAYYMAVISQSNLEQLNKSYENLKKLLAETEALYKEGFVEKLDVDRIVLSVSNLEIQVNNLTQQVELSKMFLLNSMGKNVNQSVVLTSTLPEFTPSNFDLTYGMEGSIDQRIELQILDQQQQLNQLNLKRYRVGYVPSVYLNANYGFNTFAQKEQFNALGDEWFPLSSYGLTLNVPIFDGFYKKAKAEQVKIDILKTANTLEMTSFGIQLEVAKARSEYINAYKNVQQQQKNKKLAQDIYNTSMIKFTEGIGSSFEFVQAESDLTTGSTNYLNALYQLNISKLNLDKALGKL